MSLEGCPEGMYPLDTYYDANEYATFEELRADSEAASSVLNLPLSWYFNEVKEEWDEDDWEPSFTLVFHMPRKNANWSNTTKSFDRAEVQEWLDTWLRGEINKWFGWTG